MKIKGCFHSKIANQIYPKLGGGFKYFLNFTPKPWGNDPILTRIFLKRGWFNHQLENRCLLPSGKLTWQWKMDPGFPY